MSILPDLISEGEVVSRAHRFAESVIARGPGASGFTLVTRAISRRMKFSTFGGQGAQARQTKRFAELYARGSHIGVAVEKSLGTRDRGEAERLLAKLQSEIFERQLHGGSAPGAEGFAVAAIRYMESGGERRYVAPLLRHFGDLPIDQIDQQMIDIAAAALYPKGGPATRTRLVYTPISAILHFAGVTRDIRRPRAPPGIVRWLTHDEAARLLDACSPHLRPLVLFLLLTGIGEALWLDWRNVDLVRGHVSFPKTKNGHPRGVPLHRDVVLALATLPHRDGCVFRRPDGRPYEPSLRDGASAGSQIRTAAP